MDSTNSRRGFPLCSVARTLLAFRDICASDGPQRADAVAPGATPGADLWRSHSRSQPTVMKSLSATARPVTIAANEIVELAQFIASQSGREPAVVESHLRWFLLENPARDPALSLGCGLRSPQGELVGCMLHVPQIFRFQQQTFPVILASSLYVDPRYRGTVVSCSSASLRS